jgi:LCP family protein required for cell wall assembly
MANLDMELYCDELLIANNNIKYRENYSLTLLKIMASTAKDNILLSTSFTGKKKKLKNRFYLIMNGRNLKKGTILIACFICLILVVGNIVACSVPSNSSKAENMASEEEQIITVASDNTPSKNQLVAISHVLVVGISGRDNVHTDSILVASINPNTKEIILTSFLRDMYVSIPGNGKNKLNKAFEYGGVELVKETIESNFQITIDQYLAVDMQAFEEIVNSIGGVELELTEQEANYLNSTNFISDKVYRNVIVGKQRLNGSQALGYARVRNIPTAQGEKGDLGRTVRLRSMLMSIMAEYSDKDIIELTKVTLKILPYITTDLKYDEIQTYLSTYLQEGRKLKSVSIPVEGSYEQTRVDGMSVIVPELETNQEYLKETFN